MAISTLEYDTLQALFVICKTVITDLQPKLKSMQQQYDSEGGVKDTLTQEELDSVSAFSGLTKQAVDDGAYVLTATMLPAIEAGFASLSALAARDRGFAPPLPVTMPPPVMA